MRLYSGKIGPVATEIVDSLVADQDIETERPEEVKLDIESVLKEFVRLDREVTDAAKERMEERGLGYGNLGRIKSQVAKEKGAPSQDDTLPYILEQILNMLLHSANVEEVFAEDLDLRKKLTPILKKHMDVETDLDREVRSKIKNLEEGTNTFEVEYARVMDQVKRKRGLQT